MADKVKIEKKEIDILIARGIKIDVEQTTYVRPSGIFGRLKKRVKKTETVTYRIQEPTLSTLDRLAAEQIDLFIDESMLNSDNAMCEAKKLTAEHSKRMARIIAIAVLGQDYVISIPFGNRIKYEYDDKKLNELVDIFYNNVKPTKMLQIVFAIQSMSNLGDFTNSIRLMSASRTTMPIRIEKNEKA